jgi:hypothetical protein
MLREERGGRSEEGEKSEEGVAVRAYYHFIAPLRPTPVG